MRSLLACFAVALAGYAAGRLTRPAPPPLLLERGAFNSSPPRAQTTAAGKGSAPDAAAPGGHTGAAADDGVYGADGTTLERPTDPAEVVSICGARTKRGTPCSRRVRGTGRCWQHRGRAAMLPASKLIVQD